MEFSIAVFTELQTYTLKETSTETIYKDILEIFDIPKEARGSTRTDPWMNRYCILQNNEYSYIIVPSVLSNGNNNMLSTCGKFVIMLLKTECDKNEFISVTKENIEYFKENYQKIFSKEEVKRQQDKLKQDMEFAVQTQLVGMIIKELMSEDDIKKMKGNSFEELNVRVKDLFRGQNQNFIDCSIEKALVYYDLDKKEV